MNRFDLQVLTKMRVKEAKLLLDNACYPGAYYLAGYAAECALKACIAKRIKRYEFPNEFHKTLANQAYTHDLGKLVKLADLDKSLDSEMKSRAAFATNWAVVKDWSQAARYDHSIDQKKAEDLWTALHNRGNGVLAWLKKKW